MTDKQKKSRKGSIIKKKLNIKNIKDLEKKNGKMTEVRKYTNDKYGAFFGNGQFRWVSISNKKTTTKCTCNCKTEKCNCGCPKGICNCNMKGGGGKPINLKTAVNLLRNYYSQKYD